MEKHDTIRFLNLIRTGKKKWTEGLAVFNAEAEEAMKRLIHEGVNNLMTPDMIAAESGYTPQKVRRMMREFGLDPQRGLWDLSKSAAKALVTNAELMGIKPWQMDLTSPLAYLPMGSQMREKLERSSVVSGNVCTSCGATSEVAR